MLVSLKLVVPQARWSHGQSHLEMEDLWLPFQDFCHVGGARTASCGSLHPGDVDPLDSWEKDGKVLMGMKTRWKDMGN